MTRFIFDSTPSTSSSSSTVSIRDGQLQIAMQKIMDGFLLTVDIKDDLAGEPAIALLGNSGCGKTLG